MVTIEQINKTFEKIDETRKRIAKNQLNESKTTPNFNSIEEVCKHYNAEPFDEFTKRFRSGK